MRICPTCQTEYDDDEMRFCIKDGTLLKEIQLVPENRLDPLIARERFTVSLHEPTAAPVVQPNVSTAQPRAPKQKSNAILFAVLAALLLLAGAALGAGLYFLLPARTEVATANAATNANSANSVSANSNVATPLNLNVNANSVQNSNLNLNANTKPSPSPKPSVSPSPANRNANANANANANVNQINAAANGNLAVAPLAVASPSPVAAPSPLPSRPSVVSGGVLNGRATDLPRPAYPQSARAVRASGAVNVQVTIDESGGVISATATSGHVLLRQAAVQAARQARFTPTVLSGQPVKVTGIIVYNFALN